MVAREGREERGIGGPDSRLCDRFRWESLKFFYQKSKGGLQMCSDRFRWEILQKNY